MEKQEENYIRQLLLELDEYLFSLRWYDKEDREIMLKNIIGFDSIFQIIPKRFRKLLEGRIYTQEELDKAREEVQFTKEELECILKWKDACDGEFNGMTLLPASGEDWGKEEDIENAEDKLEEMLSKLKDNK